MQLALISVSKQFHHWAQALQVDFQAFYQGGGSDHETICGRSVSFARRPGMFSVPDNPYP